MDQELYRFVRKEVGDMHLVDAHCHICSEEAWKTAPEDFTALLLSCVSDLVNAGMSRDSFITPVAGEDRMRFDYGYNLWPDGRSVEEKWAAIKPFWPYVKNIGSGGLARKALALFFGCDDFTDETVPTIQEKMDHFRKNYTYKDLLYEKARINKTCGVTMNTAENPPTELISQHLYTDIFSGIQKRRDIYRLEQYANQDIYSLDTYIKALDVYMENQVKEGIIGIKWQFFSYMRDLDFALADPFAAAKCLDRILQLPARGACGSAVSVGFDEMRPFQNYIQNHLIQAAIELDLSVQIHTGTFGGTLGNQLENSKPTWLSNIFLKYPQARFDILHAGFPYTQEMGEMAKIFPNVYLNAAWVDTLSPQAYKNCLKEWLTYIPNNKIFAFGSDQFGVFLVISSAERVRDLVAEVLTELIAEGRLTEKDAFFAADCILRKNAWEFNKFNV